MFNIRSTVFTGRWDCLMVLFQVGPPDPPQIPLKNYFIIKIIKRKINATLFGKACQRPIAPSQWDSSR